MLANRITVFKDGSEIFDSTAGQYGMPDYANRDFICFASPIARAVGYYLQCEEWAERMAQRGYETLFVYPFGERGISPARLRAAKKLAGECSSCNRTRWPAQPSGTRWRKTSARSGRSGPPYLGPPMPISPI